MNKLTINRLALGSLTRRRRQYKAMILGAALAIFFVSTLFLAVQSVYETYRLAHIGRMGNEDAILRDAESVTPDELLRSGLISEVGSIYVIGETEDSESAIGYYDEPGAIMAGRVATEGRMPERIGEIAVEPNFLQKLRSDAKLGDSIELSVKIPLGARGEFLSDTVTKTYQIVGILKPQSMYLVGNSYSDYVYSKYPSAIVSPAEQVEPGGRAVTHRLVKLAPGVSYQALEDYAHEQLNLWSTISTSFVLFSTDARDSELNSGGQSMVAIAGILGVALILAACLGIVNAFSGNLSERRSQIGMMRAVGATSRQIRRIFGREALLLALCVAPISIALSYLFVWGLTLLIGTVTFYANPLFLPIIIIASLLCVVLASWIPLLSASKLPPMQAIREVSLLRARRRIKVRERTQYDAPRLIAARHLSLYKTRQAGIAAMVALSMLLISMAVPFVVNMWDSPSVYGYQIVGARPYSDPFVEASVTPHEGLTDADVSEVLSLPMVAGVDVGTYAQINLLMDQVTPYVTVKQGINYWTETPSDPSDHFDRDTYLLFKSVHHLTKEVLPASLYACGQDILDALRPYVLEGNIDLDALNAGREVLVIAPEVYYTWREWDAASGGYIGGTDYKSVKGRTYEQSYMNDMFHAGDMLSILRLFTRGGLTLGMEGTDEYAANVQRQEAAATIGAILDWRAFPVLGDFFGYWGNNDETVLTTSAGLTAMGIETAGYFNLSVRLSGDPDDATHDYLTDTFKGIAARGNGMDLINNIQSARETAFWQRVMQACLMAVVCLLMSMCVSMVNSAITGRVKSDKRSIGTLRAVGAQLSDIVSSYRQQVLALTAGGVIGGVLLSIGYYAWDYFNSYYRYDRAFDLPFGMVALVQVAFLLIIALLCGINLSVRVREITRDSIVSNIREL